MLGLTLREEFRGKRLKGTAIELSNDTNTGATQIAAKEFLEITYLTHDLLKWSVDCSADHSLRVPEYRLWLKDHLALYGVKNAVLAPGYRSANQQRIEADAD
jgi:hypothetical protein